MATVVRKNPVGKAQKKVDGALTSFRKAHAGLQAAEDALQSEADRLSQMASDLIDQAEAALAQKNNTAKVREKLAEFIV